MESSATSLKIVKTFLLKNRLVAFVDTSNFSERIEVGTILVDDVGKKFVLSGLGMIRYRTVADMENHMHEVPVILRSVGTQDDMPSGCLRRADT